MPVTRLVAKSTDAVLGAGSISWSGSQVYWIMWEGRSRPPSGPAALIQCSDPCSRFVALVVLSTSRNHQIIKTPLEDLCWAMCTWKWQTSMSISWLEFHLPPKHMIEEERLFKYFRSGKSFCRSCALGISFLCTLVKCGRALMNEELSCCRELFQRLHLSHSVYRGAGDKEKAVAGRLFIS